MPGFSVSYVGAQTGRSLNSLYIIERMSIIEGIRNAEMNLQIGILLCQYNIAFLFCDLRDFSRSGDGDWG